MARVSIYVSDDLKSRMSAIGDALNWSDIARPAFESAISNFNHRKDKTVQTAIERLKASKAKHQSDLSECGFADGYDWARDHAEFHHLIAVNDLDDHADSPDVDAFDMLKGAIDPDEVMSVEEFNEMMFGSSSFPHKQTYAIKFIDGMQSFYQEIKNKI